MVTYILGQHFVQKLIILCISDHKILLKFYQHVVAADMLVKFEQNHMVQNYKIGSFLTKIQGLRSFRPAYNILD